MQIISGDRRRNNRLRSVIESSDLYSGSWPSNMAQLLIRVSREYRRPFSRASSQWFTHTDIIG